MQQVEDRKQLVSSCSQIDDMYDSLAAHEQKVQFPGWQHARHSGVRPANPVQLVVCWALVFELFFVSAMMPCRYVATSLLCLLLPLSCALHKRSAAKGSARHSAAAPGIAELPTNPSII